MNDNPEILGTVPPQFEIKDISADDILPTATGGQNIIVSGKIADDAYPGNLVIEVDSENNIISIKNNLIELKTIQECSLLSPLEASEKLVQYFNEKIKIQKAEPLIIPSGDYTGIPSFKMYFVYLTNKLKPFDVGKPYSVIINRCSQRISPPKRESSH